MLAYRVGVLRKLTPKIWTHLQTSSFIIYPANIHKHTGQTQIRWSGANNDTTQVTHVVLYYHLSCINTTFNKLSQQWGRYSRHILLTVLSKIQHTYTHTHTHVLYKQMHAKQLCRVCCRWSVQSGPDWHRQRGSEGQSLKTLQQLMVENMKSAGTCNTLHYTSLILQSSSAPCSFLNHHSVQQGWTTSLALHGLKCSFHQLARLSGKWTCYKTTRKHLQAKLYFLNLKHK